MSSESRDPIFEKLTDGNYFEWKVYMFALLVRKELMDYVDGTAEQPGENETKKFKEFIRKQAEARSEIILRVSPSQLSHCRASNPYEIWKNLANIHSAKGRATVIALRRRFQRLRFEPSETMSAYISRVRYVAFLIEEANATVSDDDLILTLTAGLPHSYNSLLISLDSAADSEYTLNTVITRLINEYQRQHQFPQITRQTRAISGAPDEAMSVSTSTSTHRNLSHITCFTCGNKGHYQANCPTRTSTNPSPPVPVASHEFSGAIEEDSDSDGIF